MLVIRDESYVLSQRAEQKTDRLLPEPTQMSCPTRHQDKRRTRPCDRVRNRHPVRSRVVVQLVRNRHPGNLHKDLSLRYEAMPKTLA